MSELNLCPKCGRPLGINAPHELCPACLVGAMMTESEASVPEQPADETLPAGSPEYAGLPGAAPGIVTAPNEQAGERIGRYKLLQQIGEGGFGTVWMAEQVEPVTRRVALKIIKLGMDTREVIARFEAERQALAMMDHPNIARVLDAGSTDKGRPFFVMELVKGIPITQFCDEQHLGMKERLVLFADVCAAINHAHQKGIIHRDIKPSNVLVTLHADKPVVKVIDFGIAKATMGKLTDKTLFTRFEQFIGTPVYMSPEQAALSGLDIDTRSDIYALGILLYELLTGKPPFDAKSLLSAGYDEMRRIIREVEPAKPSSRLSTVMGDERTTLAKARDIDPGKLSRMVVPDLDWIVMKAIEKDRTRRYETANGLALDIQRFLADEPVSATPPTAGYKFRKFARRNKTALRVAAIIALLLVAGTTVSTLLAIRAVRAEKEVTKQRDDKALALHEAEETARIFTEILGSPSPARDSREITVVNALKGAAVQLESGLAGQPAIQARLGATLGATWHALGLTSEAIPLQRKVWEFYERTYGPEHLDTILAKGALALSLFDTNDRMQGVRMQEEVLAVSRAVLGEKHPATVMAQGRLAVSIYFDGRKQEGLKALEHSLALSTEVFGGDARETLPLRHWLATAYEDEGQEDKAIAMNEALLPDMRKAFGERHPETIRALSAVADSRLKSGRAEEARRMHQEVLQLSREIFGPVHPNTLGAMAKFASALRNSGHPGEALTLREETLKYMQSVGQEDSPDSLWVMEDLASSYSEAGQKPRAMELRRRVLDLSVKKNGADSDLVLLPMARLAKALAGDKQLEEAIRLQTDVVPRMKKYRGDDHPDTIWVMGELAGFYTAAARKDEALALRREVLALQVNKLSERHASTISAMVQLAEALADSGSLTETIATQEKALIFSREVNAATPSVTVWIMGALAGYYEQAGRTADAAKLREEREALKRDAKAAPGR